MFWFFHELKSELVVAEPQPPLQYSRFEGQCTFSVPVLQVAHGLLVILRNRIDKMQKIRCHHNDLVDSDVDADD